MRKLLLFDIDGTLLWTDGAGRRAIHAAVRDRLGLDGPFDGIRFDGKTDPQIVREMLAAAGRAEADDETHVTGVCERYVELLEGELARGGRRLRVYPGVVELLDALEAYADALVGLLTGNVVRGADLKLRAAGIPPERFRVGAYGSDAAERSALPPIAAARAEPLMGRRPTGTEIVIIGDTPADMTCGAALGVLAVGVATGSYTRDELLDAGGAVAFDSLADTDAVLDVLLA